MEDASGKETQVRNMKLLLQTASKIFIVGFIKFKLNFLKLFL